MQGSEKTAPPGQQWRQDMPRFGLPRFAKRVVSSKPDQGIDIAGLSAVPFNATAAMIDALPQITMSADFHGRVRKSCWLDDEYKATIRVLVTSFVICALSHHALFLQRKQSLGK